MEQSEKVKDKIDHVLLVLSVTERVPTKFLEHITGTDGLYVIRIEYQSNIHRVFCCFDEGKIVVVFNGFHKKSQRTPQVEIEKALRIKNEYFKEKLENENRKQKPK